MGTAPDKWGYSVIGRTGSASGKESACQHRRCRILGFDPWVGKIPWRRKWQYTPVFLPGKSHGQRSLVGHSPWGCKSRTRLKRLSTQARSQEPSPSCPGEKGEQTVGVPDNSHPIQGCTSFQLLLLQLDGSHHRPQVHTCSRREGVSTRAPATARLWETRLQLPRLLCHGYGSQGAPGGAAAKPHHLFHFLSSVSNNLGEGNGIPLQYSCLENPGRLRAMGSLGVRHN